MLTTLTDAIYQFITSLYMTTGLAGIVLAMAIESFCIPLPSEIVMPLAGVMIVNGTLLKGVNPVVGIILVALAGALGNLIGSVAAYWVGATGGRPLMLKYGRYVLISQHDADRADAFFQRWGSATAFFSRLLPVVRTYISLPAGIAKMPFVKFCIFTFLGAFPWSLLLAYIGTIIGNNLSALSPIFHSLDVVVIVALVILVALYIWRHIRNDRRARAAHAAGEAQAAAQQQGVLQNGWGQQQSGWTQAPQQWGQPGQPVQPVQPPFSQPPQSPQSPQPTWGQPGQPVQQQPFPPQQGRGVPRQEPFPPQNWGQTVPQHMPPQPGRGPQAPQLQPPQQQWGRVSATPEQPWASPNGDNGWNGQGR